MSEPLPAMEQAEQDRLTRQVGRALLTVAPAGWTQIRAEYRSAGRHIEVDVFVAGPDGPPRPVRPPAEVVEGLGRLRQGMYRPGRGTWLSAVYLLEPPSSFSVEFEPDVEPRWRRLPPTIGFQDELRFFPRAEEHLPDWLRQRAGLPPPAPVPPPQPPSASPQPAAAPAPPPGAPPSAPLPPGGPSPSPAAAPPRMHPPPPTPPGQPQPVTQPHPPPTRPHHQQAMPQHPPVTPH